MSSTALPAAELASNQVATLRSDPSVQFVAEDRSVGQAPRPGQVVRCEDVQGDDQCLPDGIDRIDADNQIGVVGVAPGTPLWAAKVNDPSGEILLSYLLCAVDWVTSTRTDRDPKNDIAVANMSLGGPNQDDRNCGRSSGDALHLAICRSVAAGVTYVVSAGNEASNLGRFSPANYDEVLTATAMGDFDGRPGGRAAPDCYGLDYGAAGQFDDQYAVFSNFAAWPHDRAHVVAAPGVCIETTFP